MLILVLLFFGFILLSGLLSMTDAAILSVSYAEVEEIITRKKWGSVALAAVYRRLTRAVAVTVIATNTVNILGPILIGQQAVQLYGSAAIGVVTAALTVCTIVFSEIIPKALGTHYAPSISRAVAPMLLVGIVVLYPVVIVLERLVGIFKIGKRPIGTEEQIRALAKIGGGAGHIRESEGELIHRVFILNDRRASDLMTPRRKVIGLQQHMRVRDALLEVARHPHSRYPVFETSLDEIRGLVMVHDLYEAVGKGKEDAQISTIMRGVLFVPAAMRSDALLMLFRRRRIHLAVVQDGHRTIGIVSLEDVLEELVGEIEDERDAAKILT